MRGAAECSAPLYFVNLFNDEKRDEYGKRHIFDFSATRGLVIERAPVTNAKYWHCRAAFIFDCHEEVQCPTTHFRRD